MFCFLLAQMSMVKKFKKEAEKNKKNPKLFCDELSDKFGSLTKTLNLTNDDFIRTQSQDILNLLMKFGVD